MKAIVLGAVVVVSVGLFGALAEAAELVNINTAGKDELMTLSGIGEVKAQAIIDYRGANGAFKNIEEIKNVSGIGDATYAKIEGSITVGSAVQTPEDTPNPEEEEDTASSSGSEPASSSALAVAITGTSVVIAGAEVVFEARATKGAVPRTAFRWNFGDGVVGKGEYIKHTFAHPGKYVVMLSASSQGVDAEARLTVEVVPNPLSLVVGANNALGVENTSGREAHIGGWSISTGEEAFFIPEGTVVLPQETIYFSPEVTGIAKPLGASLYFPSGEPVGVARIGSPAPVVSQSHVGAKTVSSAAAPKSISSTKGEALVAAVSESKAGAGLPLWVYGTALGGLVLVAGAAALVVRPVVPAVTKRPEDEFEIQ